MGVPQTTGHHPISLGPVDPTNQQPFFDDEEIELDVPENFNVCKSPYTYPYPHALKKRSSENYNYIIMNFVICSLW